MQPALTEPSLSHGVPREGPSGRAFWLLVLAIDLVFLVLLAKITYVAAAALGLAVAVAFLARAEWCLAFLFLGGPLLAPLRLTGGEHTALLVGVRAVFFGAWAIAVPHRRETVRRALGDPATLMVLGLALWLWIGLARTPAPDYGDGKAKSFLLSNVMLYLAPLLLWPLWRKRAHLARFLRGGVAIGALFAGVGVLAAFGIVSSGLEGPASGRLAWLATSPIWVARLLAIWIVLLLWAASQRLVPRLPAALLTLLGLWLMLRTGSRGPLVALLVSPLAILLLPSGPGEQRGVRVLLLRVVPAVLLAGLLIVLVLPSADRDQLLAVLARAPAGALSQDSGGLMLRDPAVVYRSEILARGRMALSDALPWGAGTGSFPALLFLRDFPLYPHNIEVELLIEQGWPGALLFVALLVVTWRRARTLRRLDARAGWLFVLFAMAWLNAQVSGDLAGNAEIWFWAGLVTAVWLGEQTPVAAARASASGAAYSSSQASS
jgi:O-antigen ligase